MAYYKYPPASSGGNGIPEYPTFADFPDPTSVSNGTFAFALDTETLYVSDGTQWIVIAGPGVALSIGTFDSGIPSANGAHIDSNELIMQSASATVPGLVNTGAQTLAGAKTFSTAPILSSLTASQALVLDASKNVATLAYTSAATASTLVVRDANANAYANNWISNSTFVTSTGGTTNLTPANARVQILTGTSNQTFKLPNANTFGANGATYEFNNNSTGTLTVNDFSNGLITTIPSGGYGRVILTDNATSAGVWDKHFLIPANGSYGTSGMSVTGTFQASSTVQGTQLVSTIATGTPPLVVASTTQVANLNAATSGSFTGSLSGDVTGTQSATVLSATTNGTLTTLSALTTASSLASVGTITSGTWAGTTIAVNHGGTGVTSLGNLTESTSSVLTITGGTGALITSASIQVKQASTSVSGYLSSTDWNTFNNKQASGNYITALTGDVTASGPGSVAASLVATSNATLTTLSALTTASSLASVGTITSGTWSATTIALNKGGTGQTTKTAAFDALSPMTTQGDLILGGASGTGTRLAIGATSGNVLKTNGTTASWGLPTQPTVTSFTSGSGSYSTPAGCTSLRITMCGAGGSGGGSTNASATTTGGNGGVTTFGTTLLQCNGGSGGGNALGQSTGGAGGTASLGGLPGWAITGGAGCVGNNATGFNFGGYGGEGPFGGGGSSAIGAAGGAGATNTGAGGAGGGTGASTQYGGNGGGAGGYLVARIDSPNASYNYAVGAAGVAGSGGSGTNIFNGGLGGSGFIIIEEFYI